MIDDLLNKRLELPLVEMIKSIKEIYIKNDIPTSQITESVRKIFQIRYLSILK